MHAEMGPRGRRTRRRTWAGVPLTGAGVLLPRTSSEVPLAPKLMVIWLGACGGRRRARSSVSALETDGGDPTAARRGARASSCKGDL